MRTRVVVEYRDPLARQAADASRRIADTLAEMTRLAARATSGSAVTRLKTKHLELAVQLDVLESACAPRDAVDSTTNGQVGRVLPFRRPDTPAA